MKYKLYVDEKITNHKPVSSLGNHQQLPLLKPLIKYKLMATLCRYSNKSAQCVARLATEAVVGLDEEWGNK